MAAGARRRTDLFGKILSVFKEPLKPLAKNGQILDDLILQNQAGIEGNETHH